MNLFQAAILGIVQGLTEFLPISSSGHLVIVEQFFGLRATSLHFEIAIHFATLLAVIVFFFSEIKRLKFQDYVTLAIGTVPAVLVGVLLKDLIEAAFSSLLEVAFEFMITGLTVLFAQKKLTEQEPNSGLKKISQKHSFLIGIAQAVAIFPAISRSGATVATALQLNVDRETAFKFSFLLSIPAILGATVLSLAEIAREGFPQSESIDAYIVGAILAFIFGFVSLLWFRKIIQSMKLQYFGYYCCGLSVLLFVYQFSR